MNLVIRIACLFSLVVAVGHIGIAQEASTKSPKTEPQIQAQKKLSAEEIRSLLDSIDPYLPTEEAATEIDIFGSTSMDVLAHSWASGFKKFHEGSKFVISAEGSETVIDRLSQNNARVFDSVVIINVQITFCPDFHVD